MGRRGTGANGTNWIRRAESAVAAKVAAMATAPCGRGAWRASRGRSTSSSAPPGITAPARVAASVAASVRPVRGTSAAPHLK